MKSIRKTIRIIEGYQKSQVLITAVELGIFKMLEEKPTSLNKIAQKLAIPERPLHSLLEALRELDMVKRNGNTLEYSATDISIQCFGEKGCIRNWTSHQGALFGLWVNLPMVIKSNKPILKKTHDINVEAYEKGLVEEYLLSSPKLHEVVTLSGSLTMLDAGGGLGIYSVFAALENPSLKAVVFDRPEVIVLAKELIKQYQVESQVSTQKGDLLKDNWPGNQNVVLVSNVLHGKSFEEAQIIVSKAFNALSPGGRILVNERIRNFDPEASFFDLNMLLCTLDGGVRDKDEISQLVKNVGFTSITWQKLNHTHWTLVGYKLFKS